MPTSENQPGKFINLRAMAFELRDQSVEAVTGNGRKERSDGIKSALEAHMASLVW
ncbi:hypothetical protein [Burkholderia stabilis]|uniref:hypothetical protein n=1 Tax=Burkholderia stabilis TaxID=95485 RepID=UPI001592631D|nr:hypothetical protein [Burkholderia stabilis]